MIKDKDASADGQPSDIAEGDSPKDYDEVYVIESHSAAAVGGTPDDDEDDEYYENNRP